MKMIALLARSRDQRGPTRGLSQDRAYEHTLRPFRTGGSEIEQPMQTVHEVHISRSAVAVERLVPRRAAAAVRERGAVPGTFVGLDLGNHCGHPPILLAAHVEFAEQIPRDVQSAPVEAVPAESRGCVWVHLWLVCIQLS